MQYCKSISCAKINAVLLQKCYNKGSIAKVLQELLHYIINNSLNAILQKYIIIARIIALY